jgi:hypothetical protein
MAADDLTKRLEALPPEARARVESALMATIESELAGSRFGGAGPAASFSRGILFSKSGALRNPEELVLPALAEMDESKYQQFAKRLTELRSIRSQTGRAGAGGS